MENNSANSKDLFPQGERAPSDYFTGTAWVKNLVPLDDILNTVIGNVRFEPGARNNWHTHAGGQILIVTEGTGYYQERGKPKQVINRGDVIKIPPDVEHWHGAAAESGLTHIAVNTNVKGAFVVWLDRVTDEDYLK